ncbi:hypothetical protein AWV79_00315 [Cupriavidus sp. UYMMa02A]|nr:hypothetical protein AWV79_00315 [Cupriavidus sp. UYMMa02A]
MRLIHLDTDTILQYSSPGHLCVLVYRRWVGACAPRRGSRCHPALTPDALAARACALRLPMMKLRGRVVRLSVSIAV